MGIFDDLMYPDNKNRALRASQLGQDCGDIAYSVANDKEKIEASLSQANSIIREAYQMYIKTNIPYTEVKIDEHWVLGALDLISPVITFDLAYRGLHIASKAWLLRQGRIGEAAFADLVGLPKWFGVGKVMGGVAASFAVEAIISSIEGAVQRDKLRDAIHDLIHPRIKIKQSAMINDQILLTLQSVLAAYQAILNIPDMTFTKEQLDAIAKNLVNKNKVNIESFTEQKAAEVLADMDRARSAWTYEDR